MFSRLAERYNLANRWMTWGQDGRWRREVIERAQLPTHGRLLDIGAGTGDLALEAIRQDRTLRVVAADFSPEMMIVGARRDGAGSICWVNNDALELPFGSGSFDAVVSGYLLRNVSDVKAALHEQYRVLKAGGRLVCLDTTPPPSDLWHRPVHLYLKWVIPMIGGWVSGDMQAYRYLTESTKRYITASSLAECLREVGFKEVGYRCFMGASMAIHWAIK